MLICVIVVIMILDIEIIRKILVGKEGWMIGKDMFKIFLFLCGEIYNCLSFDVEVISVVCICLCFSYFVIFIFYNEIRGC